MLEKSLVSLIAQVVSNVAGLPSDLVLPIKAKKLWKTGHTFNLVISKDLDMATLYGQMTNFSQYTRVSNSKSEIIIEYFCDCNSYTLALDRNGDQVTLSILPIIHGVPIYEVEFGHTVEEGKFVTLKREPDLSSMISECTTLPQSYLSGILHAIQKASYSEHKKFIKKLKDTDKKKAKKEKKAKKKESKEA